MTIQEIVADPEWQALRKSLVGTWKSQPTVNVRKLERYLGDKQDWYKLRRVQNYLTGSVFRTRTVQHRGVTILLISVRTHLMLIKKLQ